MARPALTDNRLTIADLKRELDVAPYNMDRSAIQRYDANPDVRRILGKEDDVYPADSLQWWRKLAEARLLDPPDVTPATAGRFLTGIVSGRAVPVPPAPSAIIDNRQTKDIAMTGTEDTDREAGIAAMFQQAVKLGVSDGVSEGLQRAAAAGLLPDKLLTLKEAREETGMAESTIRELVSVQERVGGRRKWKRSVLLSRLSTL